MKRIRNVVSKKILYQLYFANIYSHLIFMNPIWSAASSTVTNKLFILQKKIIKFIEFKSNLARSSKLFSARILPLPVISEFNILIIAFKIKHNIIKNNIVLRYVGDIHEYGTRQINNFYVYTHQSSYGDADFYRRGLIKFNELSDRFKSITSLGEFKNQLRVHLCERYFGGSSVR